jgi:hypothetical protein
MSFWSTFWAWFLLLGLVLFLGLAVVVSIGGFFDIRTLFKSIRSQHDRNTH